MRRSQALLQKKAHKSNNKINYSAANQIAYFLQLSALNTQQQHLNSSASKYNAKFKIKKQQQ